MAVADGPTSSRRNRGRPKGSGIDDTARLAEIRTILAARPSTTPTAAIRAAGIDDPSVIRRLRDKLSSPSPDISRTERVPPPTRKPAAEKPARTPLAATPNESRQRDAELLAAYMEAMAKPAPPPEQPLPEPPRRTAPAETPPPVSPPTTAAPSPSPPWSMPPLPGFGAMPASPAFPPFPGMPGMPGFPPFLPPGGMSIPGMPSFLQPFMGKPAAPAAGTTAFRQLEAFKLAIEAMTAIARFQLHLIENAPAYGPMALMLQGQTFMGQMMMASLTGQMDAMKRGTGTS